MERIQQALNKAKAEQERLANSTDKRIFKSINPLATKIDYTETKVVYVSAETYYENRVVAALKNDPRGDLIKILRTKVLQKLRSNKWNMLAITSPTVGAGKSLVATNLAISMALDANHSVLLADLDLRRPSVHKYFGYAPEFGLRDYFTRDKDIPDLLFNPSIESLVVLPAGREIRDSSELLSSPMMLELADELKNRYPERVVIVDLPPLLHTDDAMAFLPNVDACLLVIEEGKTTTEQVERSMQIIDRDKFLGCVLNKSGDEWGESYSS